MARFTAMINQFNGGYMSQRMNARTNLENWPTYLKDSCNFLPTVWGGNKFRSGTKFVAETDKSHFIPFIFNNSIAYVVEFCDGFCRFYRNWKPVFDNKGNILKINSPYSYDSITGPNGECLIKKQQSGDVMYIATGKHPLYKLLRIAENNFDFSEVRFKNGPYNEKIFVNPEKWVIESINEKTILLKYNTEFYSTGFMNYSLDIFPGGFPKESAYEIDIYVGGEAKVSDIQLAPAGSTREVVDMVFSFINSVSQEPSPGYIPFYDLGFFVRFDEQNPNNTLEAYPYEGKEEILSGKEINISVTHHPGDGTLELYKWTGTFTLSEESPEKIFNEKRVGSSIRFSYNKKDVIQWVNNLQNVKEGTVVESDGKYYLFVGNAGIGVASKKPVHTEGIESDGLYFWRFIGYGYNTGEIVEVPNNYSVKVFFEENTRHISNSINWYQTSIFGGETSIFPSSVFFFKERLCLSLIGSNVPQIAFSQTGDYENFDPLVGGEVTDESAILSDLVVGEVDVVNWGVGLDDVLLATESNFLLVSPATTAENFSPTNIKIDYISSNGASKIAPVVHGDSVLYIDEKNSSLYTNGYYWESDGYKTAKISWQAEDLFEGGVKSVVYQKDPDSCFWILTKSGDLISFVYEQAQNVSAFGYHATDGEVQSICCIPSSDGKREELWLNVKRILPDGTIKYFVEVMQSNIYDNLLWAQNRRQISSENYNLAKENLKKISWYVDCGVEKKSEEAFTEVEGLEHLEGKTVCAVAEGEYIKDLVVTEGKVNLGKPCNYAIVGLPYEGYFVPNTINAGSQNGASQGKTQRIHAATIRVFRSRDFKCGDGVRMKEVIVSKDGKAGEGVLTGDVRIAFPGTYSNRYSEDSSAEIVIKQDKPYPLCVNGLILEMETYDA